MSLRIPILAWMVALAPLPTLAQECPATPFECAVDAAIERGLQALRGTERGTGVINGRGRENCLGVLAFLEQRDGVGRRGTPKGYRGLSPDDQALVTRLVRAMINDSPALLNPAEPPYVYATGGGLSVLSIWLATGGPDDVGADVIVSDALANGIVSLHQSQGDSAPHNMGGWNYRLPTLSGDNSTTGFAVWGLSAASNQIAEAADVLASTPDFLGVNTNADGGAGYNPRADSSSSMTASNLWSYRLLEIPAGDPRLQLHLGWLRANYTYDRMIGGFAPASTYHYLWLANMALFMSGDDGLGGAVYAEDFGDRNPALEGYVEEAPSAYFDFAVTLLEWQDPQGAWGTGFNGGARGWNQWSGHTKALLMLEHSLGGACFDLDDDGVCGLADTCPTVPSADMTDTDNDGVGDICDNCPAAPNPGQTDIDRDGFGDACDNYNCVPDGQPEICDGIDNDCDALIDVLPDGSSIVDGDACGTRLPGECAVGRLNCSAAGAVVCGHLTEPEAERCDQLDNDCDGRIDEGVLNPCGLCGPEPVGDCADWTRPCADACAADQCVNGRCLGELEDACAGVDCGTALFCRDGACVRSCAAISCQFEEACLDGTCAPVECAGDECASDPCAGVRCPRFQRCQVFDETAQCVADWLDFVDDGTPPVEPEPRPEPEPERVIDAAVVDHGIPYDAGTDDRERSAQSDDCAAQPGQAPTDLVWSLLILAFGALRRRHR